ncbi:MAG: hypothetical protein AAFP90_19010, partial [Planctomycetota bacterium]
MHFSLRHYCIAMPATLLAMCAYLYLLTPWTRPPTDVQLAPIATGTVRIVPGETVREILSNPDLIPPGGWHHDADCKHLETRDNIVLLYRNLSEITPAGGDVAGGRRDNLPFGLRDQTINAEQGIPAVDSSQTGDATSDVPANPAAWKMTPVAVVMRDPRDGAIVVLDAPDGAEVTFTQPMDLFSGKQPEIKFGRLMGQVSIRSFRPVPVDDTTLTRWPSSAEPTAQLPPRLQRHPDGRTVLQQDMSVRATNVGIDRRRIWTTETVEIRWDNATAVGRDLTLYRNPVSLESKQSAMQALDRAELIYLDHVHVALPDGGLWKPSDAARLPNAGIAGASTGIGSHGFARRDGASPLFRPADRGKPIFIGASAPIHRNGPARPDLQAGNLETMPPLTAISDAATAGHRKSPPAELTLRCGGRVVFDFPSATLKLTDDVRLEHQIQGYELDSVDCDQVTIAL